MSLVAGSKGGVEQPAGPATHVAHAVPDGGRVVSAGAEVADCTLRVGHAEHGLGRRRLLGVARAHLSATQLSPQVRLV